MSPEEQTWPVGATILAMEPATEDEMEAEGWDRPFTVLHLTGGTKIYASRDEEGNGPGQMFGVDDEGTAVLLFAAGQ